ncbi:MAG TPA: hypothetical protein VHO25_01065 [Polyangiaceae bacterium]|nr:hypothetical protein [Polyangiaceae bacterium]
MTHHKKKIVHSLLGGLTLLALTQTAHANPRATPFTYPYETTPQGALEVEQYVDMTPVRVAQELPDGTLEGTWSLGSVLQTELEYGLSERLELGWYFVFKQNGSRNPALTFDGVKQRLRLRLAEAGEWPVNVGLYLEAAELHDELELEEKILLSRRFGPLNVATNLWIEQEYIIPDDAVKHIYNPTAAIAYEVIPAFSLGLEYWLRGHFGRKFSDDAKHYLGPTFLAQAEAAWLSLGAYLRLDHFSRDALVDDPYGKVWFRTVIGIDL